MNLDKIIKKKTISRDIVKKGKETTVVIDKPKVSEDKSRFFKKTWEEEKRNLFFK